MSSDDPPAVSGEREVEAMSLRCLLLSLLLWICVATSSCTPPLTSARVLVADPRTMECQNCASDDERTLVADALAVRSALNVGDWLASHITPNASYERVRYADATVAEKSEAFARVVAGPAGFSYSWAGGQVVYTEDHSTIFDGYFPHIERVSANGRRLWRRRVPSVDVPVLPFVVDDQIIYISSGPPGEKQQLVVLELATGVQLRRIPLPFDTRVESSDVEPVEFFPFFSAGCAVLPGVRVEWSGDILDPATRRSYHPAPILVVPLA